MPGEQPSVASASVNVANVNDYNPPVPGAGFNVLAGSTSNNGTISSTFGEAGIDLQAAGIFSTSVCEHFGDAWLKSRSSGSSFTSEMKDFIAPLPVNITNCGTIVIKKRTVPRGVNHDFTFHNADIPASAVFSHALDGNGNFTLNDNGNSGTTDSDGNTQTISNVPAGGPYHITEADPTPGFDLTGVSCTTGGSGDTGTRTATITVSVGQTVTCTFTNTQRGTIVVKKVTVPSPDPTNSTFAFDPTGFNSGSSFTEQNGGSQTFANLVPTTTTGGPYSVSEENPSSLGFDLTSAVCDNGTPANIPVNPGGTTTCTFTNTLRLGAIRVTKETTKSGNAALAGAQFAVKLGANLVTNLTTDANGTACVDHLTWSGAGTAYTVTETAAPNGYAINNPNPVTVTVDHNADCSNTTGVPNAPAPFLDTPLTDLVVKATSEVAGGTKSEITCVNSANQTVGTSITTFTDPAEDDAPAVKPDVYTCTITVDP
jgi:hypothetical protein